MASWIRTGGERAISQMKFRIHVRTLLDDIDGWVSDELFAELDTNGGGSLDGDELTAAMKTLTNFAKATEEGNVLTNAHVEALCRRLAEVERLARKTAEVESIDARMVAASVDRALATRIGAHDRTFPRVRQRARVVRSPSPSVTHLRVIWTLAAVAGTRTPM